MRAKKEKLLQEQLGITNAWAKSAWAKIVKSKLAKPLHTGSEALFEFSEDDLQQMRELTADERRKSEIQQAGPRAEKSLVGHKNTFDHGRDYKPSRTRAQSTSLLTPELRREAEALERRGVRVMGIVR